MKNRISIDFIAFLIISLVIFSYLSLININNSQVNILKFYKNTIQSETAIHRFYSELKLANREKIDLILNNENPFTQNYSDISCLLTTKIIYRNKFPSFSESGFFVSPENKGVLKISVKHNKFKKNTLIPYSYFRYTSPFSSYFSLYIRSLSKDPNIILNNSNGNPINFQDVMNIKNNSGIIHFGNECVLNLPTKTESDIFNPIPDNKEKEDYLFKYSGCDVSIKNNPLFSNMNLKKKDYYSSFFRFHNDNFKFKHSGNLFKGIFQKVYKKNIPIPYKEESENNIMSKRVLMPYFPENKIDTISEQDKMESILINDFDSIEDNSFFNNRITIRDKSLNSFYSINPVSSLDLEGNIVYIDRNIVYIPYIEVIKSGGVIIAPRDVYIDTINNPLNKPLTIVSLNGNILIGNTVHASLIANSSTGKISGIYKSRKKVYGNIICNDLDVTSFKNGIDFVYKDIFKQKRYKFDLGKIPISNH